MPTLQFKGRSAVETLHLSLPYRQLEPVPSYSRTEQPRLDDNLIIHGDNLLALKALMPSYAGKVKLVYIDPPYNTGNEGWVYNDNVNDPRLQAWLAQAVGRDDLTRHDKWLCMIYPRLRLLHELLRDDGAIFVSIDDNEAHHLRMLLDELFGPENFVATVVWQKRVSPANDAEFFSSDHEYITVYAKNIELWSINRLLMSEEQEANYRNPDNDPRGVWNSATYTCNKSKDERPNLYYAINNPNTGEEIWPKATAVWKFSRETHQENVQQSLVYWGKDGQSNKPRYKQFLADGAVVVPRSLWPYSEVGSTKDATSELATVIGSSNFGTPKPSSLVQRILQLATGKNDIVLDSFAGSGTTAHAVLAQNAEDGGSRRFILVEQEEYADTLTAERVRRVMAGVPGVKDERLREGYGGGFSFFQLGEALDEARLLAGSLPTYLELARYVFFTATGESLDETQVHEANQWLGESSRYLVYLIYRPDVAYLKRTPLTLAWAEALPAPGSKARLVIAPFKLLDAEVMREHKIEFCQLPFGIYRYRA